MNERPVRVEWDGRGRVRAERERGEGGTRGEWGGARGRGEEFISSSCMYLFQSEQSLGNLQRAHRTLEQRYALAQGELTTTKTALTNTKTDYENYKVRKEWWSSPESK